MIFATAEEANRFLSEMIIAQAQQEGVELSDTDIHELRTPDCGHTVDEDERIDESLPPGYSAWTLRRTAVRYLRKAYIKAKTDDSELAASFKGAYSRLRGSQFLLGNLTHSDAPVLAAVDFLHLESLFDLTQGLLGMLSPYSIAPPIASHRPTIVGALLLAVALLAGFAVLLVMFCY